MVSLREIGSYIERYGETLSKEEKNGVQMYLQDAKQGYYWLNGQLKMHLEDAITSEDIDRAIELDRCRKMTYVPCNSFEIGSIENHNYKFVQLQSVLRQMKTGVSMSINVPAEN
jgi:hypothetical protein